MIMTLTDLGSHLVRSKSCRYYVYFFHATASTHKIYTHTAFKNYDIILSNGEYQTKELIEAEEVFGSIEAVKTVSDLFMPLTATITNVNEKLLDDPEVLNSDPYEEGWLIKATIPKDDILLEDLTTDLLSHKEYKDLTI